MANEPTTPEPDQILPPPPVSPLVKIGLVVGVVAFLVVAVLLLQWTNRPYGPTDIPSLPTLGAAAAPLTIYEYASFGCEQCAKVRKIVKEVMSQYEGKVKLVYVSFPQASQPSSTRAAMAGVCAAEQNKFWEFAELMFERQSSWVKDPDPAALWTGYASQVGMDTNQFARCLGSSATEAAVKQQLMMAVGQVVQQTPTFIIGESRLVNPRVIEDFQKAINRELAALNASGPK
jgi:protein-disulfide isomerase